MILSMDNEGLDPYVNRTHINMCRIKKKKKKDIVYPSLDYFKA